MTRSGTPSNLGRDGASGETFGIDAVDRAEEVDAEGGLPEVHDVGGSLNADPLHNDGGCTEARGRLGRSLEVRGAPLEHEVDILRRSRPAVKGDRVTDDEDGFNAAARELRQQFSEVGG